MIKRLLEFMKPWRGSIIITIISLIVASLLSLVTPEAVRRLTALLGDPDNLTLAVIITYVLIMVGAYLLRAFFRFISMWQAHIAAWKFVADITNKCYQKLQRLSPAYYSNKQTGEIMSRMINDTRQLELLIAHSIPDLATNVIVILGVAVMIFLINWKLALFTMIPVPIIIWLSRIFVTKVAPLFTVNAEILAGLNSKTQDNLSGMKEIQAFCRERAEATKFTDYCKLYSYVNIRANFFSAMYHPSVEFMTSIGTVVVMGVGGVLAMGGGMSTADIVGFFMYLALFYTPLSTLARLAEDVNVAGASARRVFELLDEEEKIVDSDDAAVIEKCEGEIRFENVTFSYGDGVVLDDVSFTAAPGEMVAIVGATGVGKTTIVSLIERFYDPVSGKVLLDGEDIKHLTLESLRSNISLVSQDVFLFNGTVYDNIAFGDDNATEDEVREAAALACADGFINEMPHGYETKIGERGVRLSGGQKQRIAIARAVLRKTPVMILDEATSAVDNETEAMIQTAIENLSGRQTLIVIAHRLTTIMKADKIIVLKDGKIAEQGTHGELLSNKGIYSDMFSVNQVKIGI